VVQRFDGFEWDDGNIGHAPAKHHVTLDEVEEVFFNNPYVKLSRIEVNGERRYLAIGRTDEGRFLSVIFTPRNGIIRVITAYEAPGRHIAKYKEERE